MRVQDERVVTIQPVDPEVEVQIRVDVDAVAGPCEPVQNPELASEKVLAVVVVRAVLFPVVRRVGEVREVEVRAEEAEVGVPSDVVPGVAVPTAPLRDVRVGAIERNRFAVKGGEPSRLEVKDPVSASVPYR